MRDDIGYLTASDGWVIAWDLLLKPSSLIRVISAENVEQYRISGKYISQQYLDREIKEFLAEHSPQQMALGV